MHTFVKKKIICYLNLQIRNFKTEIKTFTISNFTIKIKSQDTFNDKGTNYNNHNQNVKN